MLRENGRSGHAFRQDRKPAAARDARLHLRRHQRNTAYATRLRKRILWSGAVRHIVIKGESIEKLRTISMDKKGLVLRILPDRYQIHGTRGEMAARAVPRRTADSKHRRAARERRTHGRRRYRAARFRRAHGDTRRDANRTALPRARDANDAHNKKATAFAVALFAIPSNLADYFPARKSSRSCRVWTSSLV